MSVVSTGEDRPKGQLTQAWERREYSTEERVGPAWWGVGREGERAQSLPPSLGGPFSLPCAYAQEALLTGTQLRPGNSHTQESIITTTRKALRADCGPSSESLVQWAWSGLKEFALLTCSQESDTSGTQTTHGNHGSTQFT